MQGDFTLSNIVIDAEDKAKIIDINRRGCPVGWEPPEVAALIESKQRISMYIGVKSDIFQLGMVLWAIAMEQDEPETQPRPLTLVDAPEEIPSYYRDLVDICLSDDPRKRRHATVLLSMFPEIDEDINPFYERQATPDHEETEYIDPETAVGRDDIDNFRVLSSHSIEANGNPRSNTTHIYVNAQTDMSSEPYYYPTRGRSPSPRSLHGIEEPLYTQNHHDHSNGDHVLDKQSNDYFQPQIVSVSPSRHHGFQGFEQDSIVHSDSVHDVDVSPLTQDNHDNPNVGIVLEESSSEHFQPQTQVMPEPPLIPQENQAVEQDWTLHSPSIRGLGDSPVTQDHEDHKFGGHVLEERLKGEIESQAIPVPPPGLQETRAVEEGSKPHSKSDGIIRDMGKPRDTEAAPDSVPEVLAGIGEHSTFEHSDFPQGVLEDDLTTEMQEPPCVL